MDDDIDDLNLKPSDATDHCRWKEMIRGIDMTLIMIVMIWVEYEFLCVWCQLTWVDLDKGP